MEPRIIQRLEDRMREELFTELIRTFEDDGQFYEMVKNFIFNKENIKSQ